MLCSALLKLSKVTKFSNVLQFVSRYEAVLDITGLFIVDYRFVANISAVCTVSSCYAYGRQEKQSNIFSIEKYALAAPFNVMKTCHGNGSFSGQ